MNITVSVVADGTELHTESFDVDDNLIEGWSAEEVASQAMKEASSRIEQRWESERERR